MLRQIAISESKLLSIAVSTTRPATAEDGVDITSWRLTASAGYGPSVAAVFLDGTEALTLDSPTGGIDGPEIWGYRLAKWYRLGYLNNGLPIPIASASLGFAAQVEGVGIFERIAIAATPSAGSATASLIPIQEWLLP